VVGFTTDSRGKVAGKPCEKRRANNNNNNNYNNNNNRHWSNKLIRTQIGSVSHTTSHQMGTGVKPLQHEGDHPPPLIPKLRIRGVLPPPAHKYAY
jgi:hypothetical protein